jgi:hypothetical protein
MPRLLMYVGRDSFPDKCNAPITGQGIQANETGVISDVTDSAGASDAQSSSPAL